MKLVPPFTYSFDGRFLVGVDGVEVVCYDGFDESPLWIYRHNENVRWVFCSDVGVLAIGDTTVVALTDEGEVEGRFDLPPRCHEPIAADFSWEWSEFVIATSSEVLVAEFWPPDDSVRQVHGDGIVDVAMSSFGEILTISEDGTARLYDVDLALYEVLHATDGIRFELATWSEAGWWLSGSHHADHAEDSFSNVYLWDADGGQDPSLQCRFEVELVDGLFVSDDGDLVAVRTGSSVQIVTPTNQLLAHLAYDRAVGPVCFVDEWVGVGLDRADANKLNLLTGALHRSDTHPERTHNSWLVHQAVYPEVATA